MVELTQGELRDIDSSTHAWHVRAKNAAMSETGEVSDEDMQRIFDMEDAYREAFMKFYMEAREQDKNRLTSEIQAAFDEVYSKEVPEFYQY